MWVRSGECCHCGDCCSGSPHGEGPPVDGMCPLLRPGPNETRLCSVHETDHEYWNKACKFWPWDPHQIETYSRCTFTFTWVEVSHGELHG
jgi:hypothetical protein